MMKLVAALAIAAGIAHADTIHSETLTTQQTTVYDETTNTAVIYGPATMSFLYDEQAAYTPYATTVLSFSLSGFTFVDLRMYPDLSDSSGFDGLDIDGTATNGDVLGFGYAFADHAFSTHGVYKGGTYVPPSPPDSALLAVDITVPEPASLLLLGTGIVVLLVLRSSRIRAT
jgi:hypothetical protein